MSVIPKKLPEITRDDKTYAIALWMFNPEIVCFAKYDHKTHGKIALKQAKDLKGKSCYEMNDFRHKDVVHCENRIYFGTITYTRGGAMKIIQTNKGILYYI